MEFTHTPMAFSLSTYHGLLVENQRYAIESSSRVTDMCRHTEVMGPQMSAKAIRSQEDWGKGVPKMG